MATNTEIILCFIIWTSAVLYSVYCFAIETKIYFDYYDDAYGDFKFEYSWIIHRKKDAANFEWEANLYYIRKYYLWLIIHTFISEIFLRMKLIKILKYFRISFTLFWICLEFGSIPLIVILVQPLLFTCISYLKSIAAIWIGNCICLILISIYKELNKSQDTETYLVIAMTCWINLRSTSYYLENFDRKLKKFEDFFAYCLYFPTFLLGPLIMYKDFKNCYDTNRIEIIKDKLQCLIWNITKTVFWIVFLEFALHFVYVNAVMFHPELVESISSWALYGYGYAMGQAFHITYIVTYGLTLSIAKFDGITTPTLPICIGRVHLYSDMWRYFDVGLYQFLIKCIYIPSLKFKRFQSKLVSSFLCFLYIYAWHGIENYILIWSALNFIGVTIENCSNTYYEKFLKNLTVFQGMSKNWMRRFTCAAASPLLALSAISNFYFFAGTNIGNIFFARVIKSSLATNITLLVILYCCCQVSTSLRRKPLKKDKLKSI